MRILLTAVVALSACGTWSNEDLEYLYAIPQKETLRSQLGDMGNTTKQPLSVGDPSATYDTTETQSRKFNEFIDGILGALDFIRSIPPTTRTKTSRTWGPYPDDKNAGFDVRVVITRADEKNFEWSIDMRKRMTEDWFTVGRGTFNATETLRKGRGTMFFDSATARARLMKDAGQPEPDTVDIGYSTETDPVIVEVDLAYDGGIGLSYAYNGHSDKSAVLQYVAKNPTDPNASKASFTAGWENTTAGRADYVILEGKWASAMGTECWDQGHTIVYARGYNDAGLFEIGDAGSCAKPPDLKPLP